MIVKMLSIFLFCGLCFLSNSSKYRSIYTMGILGVKLIVCSSIFAKEILHHLNLCVCICVCVCTGKKWLSMSKDNIQRSYSTENYYYIPVICIALYVACQVDIFKYSFISQHPQLFCTPRTGHRVFLK
jgi:hypothetical protein